MISGLVFSNELHSENTINADDDENMENILTHKNSDKSLNSALLQSTYIETSVTNTETSMKNIITNMNTNKSELNLMTPITEETHVVSFDDMLPRNNNSNSKKSSKNTDEITPTNKKHKRSIPSSKSNNTSINRDKFDIDNEDLQIYEAETVTQNVPNIPNITHMPYSSTKPGSETPLHLQLTPTTTTDVDNKFKRSPQFGFKQEYINIKLKQLNSNKSIEFTDPTINETPQPTQYIPNIPPTTINTKVTNSNTNNTSNKTPETDIDIDPSHSPMTPSLLGSSKASKSNENINRKSPYLGGIGIGLKNRVKHNENNNIDNDKLVLTQFDTGSGYGSGYNTDTETYRDRDHDITPNRNIITPQYSNDKFKFDANSLNNANKGLPIPLKNMSSNSKKRRSFRSNHSSNPNSNANSVNSSPINRNITPKNDDNNDNNVTNVTKPKKKVRFSVDSLDKPIVYYDKATNKTLVKIKEDMSKTDSNYANEGNESNDINETKNTEEALNILSWLSHADGVVYIYVYICFYIETIYSYE